MLMYMTRLHVSRDNKKICIMNIIFINIEGKSAIFGEFVMLLGPLTVGGNRRYKVETAANNFCKFYIVKGTYLQNIFLYFQ